MENIKSVTEIIQGVKELLEQLPKVSYGNYAIPDLEFDHYENGEIGFESLKNDFDRLDLSEPIQYVDLGKEINARKKELKNLEYIT